MIALTQHTCMYDFRFYQWKYKKNPTNSFFGKVSQNFDVKKKMISTYANDFFMGKNDPSLWDFKDKYIQIATFLSKVP